MTSSIDTRPPPARLRPRTHVTRPAFAANLVRVRTPREWNREEFFAWLDAARKNATPRIPHDGALAELAGISHSTLSNWRNGKQRPTVDKLSAIAAVLDVPARDLWVRAGLMAPDEVGLSVRPERQQLPAEDEESIRLIMASAAPDEVKEELVQEIRRMQRQHAEERTSFAQRLLDMARRVGGAT